MGWLDCMEGEDYVTHLRGANCKGHVLSVDEDLYAREEEEEEVQLLQFCILENFLSADHFRQLILFIFKDSV